MNVSKEVVLGFGPLAGLAPDGSYIASAVAPEPLLLRYLSIPSHLGELVRVHQLSVGSRKLLACWHMASAFAYADESTRLTPHGLRIERATMILLSVKNVSRKPIQFGASLVCNRA